MKRANRFLMFTAMAAMLLQVSCKKEDDIKPEPEPEPQEIIVSENTKVVDDETRAIISDVDTTNYTFTFSSVNDFVEDLKPGDILVDSASDAAPYGYLRKVAAVKKLKSGTVVETQQATLPEAVEKGSIRFRSGNLKIGQIEKMELAEGVKLLNKKDSDFTVFSFDYNNTFDHDHGEFTISGHTELEIEFFMDFKWDMDWFALPPKPIVTLFEAGVELNQGANLDMNGDGGATLSERISLGKFHFTPYVVMLGPVPVVFVPRIELFLEMDGSVSAVFTASASESLEGRIGVEYTDDGGWDDIRSSGYNFDHSPPHLDTEAEFTARIGPEVALLLYGVAGPFANVTAYSDLDAFLYNTTLNWDMEFSVGVDTEVGAKVDVLGFGTEYSNSFNLFEETLIDLNDEPYGDHIYLQNPSDESNHILGDQIQISTTYTGQTPDYVVFTIEYEQHFIDEEEPFEYTWNTQNEGEGRKVVNVSSYIDGEWLDSDAAYVNLRLSVWDEVDLSLAGLSDNSSVSSVYFFDTQYGFITANNAGTGKILRTEDGGFSWIEYYSSGTALEEMFLFSNDGSGAILTGNHKVMKTDDAGYSMEEMTYGQFDQPTFQWKNIYDISTNFSGELLAVGKDTGIPYHFHVYRAETENNAPVGEFQIPYPNEYGLPPKIEMSGDFGLLYQVFNEDEPNKSYFMITEDGGETWAGSPIPEITSGVTLHDAAIWNENKIWIVGEKEGNGIILRSDDAGNTWQKKTLNNSGPITSVEFTGPEDGYFTIGENTAYEIAKLYKTNDGGEYWMPQYDFETTKAMNHVHFYAADFGMVAGEGEKAYRYSIR
jgi:photosystem II stability/assembly factor-like uncharacterized protein